MVTNDHEKAAYLVDARIKGKGERIRARKIAPSELVMTFYFLRGATGAGGKSSRVSDSQCEAG
jgi:hypothetical protein